MTASDSWLERQYWSDVVAGRPDETIAERIAESEKVRQLHSSHIDLPYGPGERQKIDVFLPDGAGPWPALIYIHGGYWQLTGKDVNAFLAPAWLDRQVAVVTIGYRLLPTVGLADIISDVAAGMRHIIENADAWSLEKDRIVLAGLSAGAHLAAMQITSAAIIRPRAAVLLSGVYDPRPVETTTPGAALFDSLTDEIGAISPLGRAAPVGCDCLIAWGDNETDVFKSQSKMLAEHWANWGVEAQRLPITNANHFTVIEELRGDSGSAIAAFVAKALLPE